MSRAAATFRQRDVTRALRAAEAAGVAVRSIEIDPDGKVRLLTDKAEAIVSPVKPGTGWEDA